MLGEKRGVTASRVCVRPDVGGRASCPGRSPDPRERECGVRRRPRSSGMAGEGLPALGPGPGRPLLCRTSCAPHPHPQPWED